MGAYVYGDFCTGEILQLFPATAGGTQTLLLDTSNNNLSSFGEDEAGEIYITKFDNTVTRIANTPAPPACTLTISETSDLFPDTGGLGSFTMTTAGDCNWLAVSHATWIDVTSAKSNTGTGTVNFNVKPNETGMPRTGRIFAGGRAFTVMQEGLPGRRMHSRDLSDSAFTLCRRRVWQHQRHGRYPLRLGSRIKR